MTYQIGLNCVIRSQDQAIIPLDSGNGDYQLYLAWLEQGNTPEPVSYTNQQYHQLYLTLTSRENGQEALLGLTRQGAIAIVEEQINQYRYIQETRGAAWNRYIVQTRPEDIGRLQAEVLAAQIGDRQDGEIWRMADNVNVPLTNAELIEIASTVRAHIKQCFGLAWHHKAQIDALPDVDAILAYNYKVGW